MKKISPDPIQIQQNSS